MVLPTSNAHHDQPPLADSRASGLEMPIKDSLIAATALTHDLIVATRNRTDFQKAGVRVFSPFDEP